MQLNEVGIQTSSAGRPGYTGIETAAGVLGGLRPPYDTERYQAQWYTKLVDFSECDADIHSVNLFKLVDETSRAGWQSGLYYAGYVPKASARAVRNELERVGGQCPGASAVLGALRRLRHDALGGRAAARPVPFPLGPPPAPRP